MKKIKTVQQLNEVSENLNISDVSDIKLWSDVYVKIRQTIIEKGMASDLVDWVVCIGLMSELYEVPKLK